ncbi:MAG: hypothetical protein LBJ59_10510 [Zoogloeaceae bacterium]|jgi:hypothetical protein|nr:hypothetical protein [Zoogloeaceae bacterium]
MRTGTLDMQQANRTYMDALAQLRASIIKRARENVRQSHQRMRARIRQSRA